MLLYVILSFRYLVPLHIIHRYSKQHIFQSHNSFHASIRSSSKTPFHCHFTTLETEMWKRWLDAKTHFTGSEKKKKKNIFCVEIYYLWLLFFFCFINLLFCWSRHSQTVYPNFFCMMMMMMIIPDDILNLLGEKVFLKTSTPDGCWKFSSMSPPLPFHVVISTKIYSILVNSWNADKRNDWRLFRVTMSNLT